MSVQCIITGCWLVDQEHQRMVRGDLFEDGNCYIFNGCYAGTDPHWRSLSGLSPHDKVVTLSSVWPYFERRSVFVFRRDCCELNAVAREHIARVPE